MQRSISLTRREFARLGALGLALPAAASRVWAASSYSRQRLLIRFRTDPERLAAALPPPLKAAATGELQMEYARFEPPAAERTLIWPGAAMECRLLAAVEYEGQPHYLLLAGWTSADAPRIQGREFLDENIQHATVNLAKEGSVVRASLRRHGIQLHSIETRLTEASAASPPAPGYLVYRYRLHPDAAQGPLDLSNVELRRVDPTGASATASPSSSPRKCDVANSTFRWPEASLLDPYVEFPAELLEILYHEEGPAPASAPLPSGKHRSALLTKVDRTGFTPFAMHNYGRPISEGDPWRPAGWRDTASAFQLQPTEIESYRGRSELRLSSFDLIDIRMAVSPETLRPALPAECKISNRPSLRVFGLRVETSDISPVPFFEAWLLAQCFAGDEQGWYALSHITTIDGDVTLGRETFGYPSKIGEIDAAISPNEFNLQGRRLGREFLYAEGNVRSVSSGTSLSQIPIISLRGGPFPADGPAPGELVLQTWYYQGEYSVADRESLLLEFPEKAAPDLAERPDPWFEFKPFQVLSATAMIRGTMQRGPGRVIATVPDAAPYCLERCDGLLPGRQLSTAVAPTFRPKQGSLMQSEASPRSVRL